MQVLLYFSATWCTNCTEFTPLLEAYYARHRERKNFEIVLVSKDRTEAEFAAYAASQVCLRGSKLLV